MIAFVITFQEGFSGTYIGVRVYQIRVVNRFRSKCYCINVPHDNKSLTDFTSGAICFNSPALYVVTLLKLKARPFHVCILCLEMTEWVLTHANTDITRACLRRKHRTSVALCYITTVPVICFFNDWVWYSSNVTKKIKKQKIRRQAHKQAYLYYCTK